MKNSDITEKRILLVEDNLIVQMATKWMLKEIGCAVDTALDGKTALSYELNKYDMILLDIRLPDIDGVTIVKMIREKEKQQTPIKNVPIIAYTSDEKIKDECFSVGFCGFITKPADFDGLKRLIQRLP